MDQFTEECRTTARITTTAAQTHRKRNHKQSGRELGEAGGGRTIRERAKKIGKKPGNAMEKMR